jgi:voltage-gated potassium channel
MNEKAIRWVIIYSLVMYFIEISVTKSINSTGFFLWSERVIACILTLDYLLCWSKNKRYPITLAGFIDLWSFAPFWMGFLLPINTLPWIRSLRLLRLLKLGRHNKAIDHFYRAFNHIQAELKLLGYFVLVVVAFSSVAMFEAESDAQADKFGSIFDSIWWSVVTLTTIGYGDLYPITAIGRIIAMITMIFGVGVFGTFISLMGGSLVEVFREDRIAQERKEKEIETI